MKQGKSMRVKLLSLISVICLFASQSADAYNFLGHTVPNNHYVTTYLYGSVAQYSGNVSTYSQAWNTHPKVNVVGGTTMNSTIMFMADYSLDNDIYAQAINNHNGTFNIKFYKDFVSLPTVQKNETIVHEVGHVLGLAHCDNADNAISVMREDGFNNVASPLSDDVAGINALYVY